MNSGSSKFAGHCLPAPCGLLLPDLLWRRPNHLNRHRRTWTKTRSRAYLSTDPEAPIPNRVPRLPVSSVVRPKSSALPPPTARFRANVASNIRKSVSLKSTNAVESQTSAFRCLPICEERQATVVKPTRLIIPTGPPLQAADLTRIIPLRFTSSSRARGTAVAHPTRLSTSILIPLLASVKRAVPTANSLLTQIGNPATAVGLVRRLLREVRHHCTIRTTAFTARWTSIPTEVFRHPSQRLPL